VRIVFSTEKFAKNFISGLKMEKSAVQCSAVQCSAVQCSAVQCSAVQCSAVQRNAVQCSAVYYGDFVEFSNIWLVFDKSSCQL
jgi:hypothetical protein